MASAKTLLGGAGATAALGIRLARSLHTRWRSLAPAERERIAPLAEHAKASALDLRGVADRPSAERDLAAANETLAAALVESAEADPELSQEEVSSLRDELKRELERLASADISASRGEAGKRSS
jgi:hypothetical protein